MNQKKDKPMPSIAFRIMSLIMMVVRRFTDVKPQLRKSGVREGQTVLDFGCGPGYCTIGAAQIVGKRGKVYALDIHPLAIKAVGNRAKKDKLTNITTILSDKDTGLPDESVDIVLLYATLQMIKDIRGVFEELSRVLKQSGTLSILPMPLKRGAALGIAEKDNLFSLSQRQGKLLNFKKVKTY